MAKGETQVIYCETLLGFIDLCKKLVRDGYTFKAYVEDLRIVLTGGY